MDNHSYQTKHGRGYDIDYEDSEFMKRPQPIGFLAFDDFNK